MQNQYNWPLWHWHFEISSICTLKCPRCPRTELPESLIQTQLKLDFFEKNFSFADKIKRITFCGDDGDPIYARDLIPIVDFFKKNNPLVNINIITNGSYKTAQWWKSLASVLNENDRIHFSIDGWDQQSNEKYRINSDWESIIDGIHAIKNNKVLLQWDAIAFRFNQDKIEYMKQLAKNFGFDSFQLTKSTKFGSKYSHYNDRDNDYDSLEPTSNYVAEGHRFTRTVDFFTNRKLNDKEIIAENVRYFNQIKQQKQNKKIVPLCLIGTKGMFVNSQGYLIPCCWVANRYNHTGLNKFLLPSNNIKLNGLESVLNADHWNLFIDEFENMIECNNKCSSHVVDKEYATNW